MCSSQLHQEIRILDKDTSFSVFRSVRTKLAWDVHTRPDIACAVSFLAQTTEKTFDNESIKEMNKVIKHLRSSPELCLRYPKLRFNDWHLTVY